jgi:DNA-binding transcriptional ArsR family regulator
MHDPDPARLDAVFAALADPTRRAILARLASGDATVSELGEPFGMAQPTISKHLRVLEDAGLIRVGRDAQRRPQSLVVGGPLEDVDVWLAPFRAQWERRFDRLEAFLETKAPRTKTAKTAETTEDTTKTTKTTVTKTAERAKKGSTR